MDFFFTLTRERAGLEERLENDDESDSVEDEEADSPTIDDESSDSDVDWLDESLESDDVLELDEELNSNFARFGAGSAYSFFGIGIPNMLKHISRQNLFTCEGVSVRIVYEIFQTIYIKTEVGPPVPGRSDLL